jgi:secreted trypsin-like serine protease
MLTKNKISIIHPIYKTNIQQRIVEERVINGIDVNNIYKYPWMCTVLFDGFLCGGSYIGGNVVLTAAHCTFNNNQEAPAANFGVHLLVETLSSFTAGASYAVNEVIRHPNFRTDSFDYDVALLILDGNPFIDYNISPINIIDQNICKQRNAMIPGSQCILIGFGRFNATGEISSELKEATLKVSSQQELSDTYNLTITDGMIGAVDSSNTDGDPTQNSCFGDSGGPLFVKIDGEFYQIGIVNFVAVVSSTDRTCINVPGGYAGVSHLKSTFDAYIALSD